MASEEGKGFIEDKVKGYDSVHDITGTDFKYLVRDAANTPTGRIRSKLDSAQEQKDPTNRINLLREVLADLQNTDYFKQETYVMRFAREIQGMIDGDGQFDKIPLKVYEKLAENHPEVPNYGLPFLEARILGTFDKRQGELVPKRKKARELYDTLTNPGNFFQTKEMKGLAGKFKRRCKNIEIDTSDWDNNGDGKESSS